MSIALEDLPDDLQALLQKATQSGIPITITQSGNPFATITPVPQQKMRPPFGFMQGTGEILGDIISPVEPS